MSQPNSLLRISVRTILPLAQFVRHRLLSAEEKSDDSATASTSEDPPDREQFSNPLAAARPADTSPVDPAVGNDDSENATEGSVESR